MFETKKWGYCSFGFMVTNVTQLCGLGYVKYVIRHKLEIRQGHKLKLQNEINEKLQKWIYKHVHKCVKTFKWTHYNIANDMQKNPIISYISFNMYPHITNLTSHDLEMEIVQNLFIHN
jgi:hypothetical protein